MYFAKSWQGVGISSTPKQQEDPISLHMLAYLTYGAEHSGEHTVVVADDLQVHNYTARFGLEQSDALRIAVKKGDGKVHQLEKLCRVNKLSNTHVVKISDVRDPFLEAEVLLLYDENEEFRDAVQQTIPKRFKGNRNTLARYVLGEIGFALNIDGTRISHPLQKPTDELIACAHAQYGIGKVPAFDYPALGLEYDPRSGMYIEPYSGLVSPKRILATDKQHEFKAKIEGIEGRQKERMVQQLHNAWSVDATNTDAFYRTIMKRSARALNFWRDLHDFTEVAWLACIRPVVLITALATVSAITGAGEKMENDYLTKQWGDVVRIHGFHPAEYYRELSGDLLTPTPGDVRASAEKALKEARERKSIASSRSSTRSP